jgi:hypothetical protein
MTVTQLAAWMKGVGTNDVREIKLNELAGGSTMPVIEKLDGYPPGTVINFVAGKEYQLFAFDAAGNRSSWKAVYPSATNAPTEAMVDLTGEGPAHFLPTLYIPPVGQKANVYLPTGYATPTFPSSPSPDAEALKKAYDTGKAAGADERDAAWQAKINASHTP